MSNDPLTGALYLLKGFTLLTQPKIKRYVMVPLLVNVLLFSAVIFFGYQYIDALIEQWIPTGLSWLRFLIWPLVAMTSLALVFFGFALIGNFIAAPFNGLLAEAVELRLTQQEPPAAARGLLREVSVAIGSEIRKLLYIGAWAIPFALLFLVPGVNVVAPLTWFVFGAWMLAIEYVDYPMGHQSLNFREQKQMLAKRRWLTLGFGSAVMLMTAIPLINFMAMPAAVAGATAMWIENLRYE